MLALIDCPCGFAFAESLGIFGCPNCNGEAMSKKADRERQAYSRAARAEAGGKQIAVMLTPEAADKLAAWVGRGETIASVVNRLLTRSKPEGR